MFLIYSFTLRQVSTLKDSFTLRQVSTLKDSFILQQVSTLKDQLSTEMKKRQQYISRSARTGDEIRDIRSMLDTSMTNVTRDQSLDPLLLETETRKLDESLDFVQPYQPRTSARRRSPNRGPKYGGLTSTPTLRRTGSPSSSIRRKYPK